MIENQTNDKREVWEQWDWVWHLTGYTALGINIIIALRGGQLGDSLPLFLTLSALVTLWYLPFVATPIMSWWNAPRRGLLYFLVGFALWGGLVASR